MTVKEKIDLQRYTKKDSKLYTDHVQNRTSMTKHVQIEQSSNQKRSCAKWSSASGSEGRQRSEVDCY